MTTTIRPRTGQQDDRTERNSVSGSPALSAGEQALICRCKAGDRSAWDALIRRYERPVYRFAFSLCHDHEQSGDIAGHVFMRLYQSLATFRNESSFSSWLFRIVRNAYLDMCVRTRERGHLSLDSTADAQSSGVREVVDPTPTPEATCLEHETSRILKRAIRFLPAYQRQAIRLYHAEGKTYEEIARETGLSIGTVKSRLNRARRMLRERLGPYRDTLLTT